MSRIPGGIVPTRAARMRYFAFGRVIPGVLFSILAIEQAGGIAAAYQSAGDDTIWEFLVGPVRLTLYLFFCILPILIYMARPMPRTRDGSLPARAAAFIGTTILMVVPKLDQGPLVIGPAGASPAPLIVGGIPAEVLDAFAVILAAFTALEVYSLFHLRLSYSIIPEARSLVTTGPYKVVRHPLYAAEITVAVAFVVAEPRLLPSAILVVFIALQYARTRFEEKVLRRTFPEYADYAAHTARLIPFIW